MSNAKTGTVGAMSPRTEVGDCRGALRGRSETLHPPTSQKSDITGMTFSTAKVHELSFGTAAGLGLGFSPSIASA